MSRDLPTLTVAVSTRAARALGIDAATWLRADGLDYLILVQEAAADHRIGPHLDAILAARDDVTVVHLASTGLSRSRNAALDHVRGELMLIADDDVVHPQGAFAAIRRAFAEDADLDVLAGRSFGPDGRARKRGGDHGHRLTRWNTARLSSHEIAFRVARVRASGIRFDERFGVGAGTQTLLGEEYVFVADCLRAGLRGRYEPIAVSIHPPESSGFVWTGAAAARARAGVMARVFGPWAPLVRVLFAIKNLRRFGGLRDLGVFLSGR